MNRRTGQGNIEFDSGRAFTGDSELRKNDFPFWAICRIPGRLFDDRVKAQGKQPRLMTVFRKTYEITWLLFTTPTITMRLP